ncbi:MAG: hypothetical protein RLZZ429_752, partial [Bacteroidota bacterium]
YGLATEKRTDPPCGLLPKIWEAFLHLVLSGKENSGNF